MLLTLASALTLFLAFSDNLSAKVLPDTLEIQRDQLRVEDVMNALFENVTPDGAERESKFSSHDRSLFRDFYGTQQNWEFTVTATHKASDVSKPGYLAMAFIFRGTANDSAICSIYSSTVFLATFRRIGNSWVLHQKRFFFDDPDLEYAYSVSTIKLGQNNTGFLIRRGSGIMGVYRDQQEILANVNGQFQSVFKVVALYANNPASSPASGPCVTSNSCYYAPLVEISITSCKLSFCEIVVYSKDSNRKILQTERFSFLGDRYQSKPRNTTQNSPALLRITSSRTLCEMRRGRLFLPAIAPWTDRRHLDGTKFVS